MQLYLITFSIVVDEEEVADQKIAFWAEDIIHAVNQLLDFFIPLTEKISLIEEVRTCSEEEVKKLAVRRTERVNNGSTF